MMRREQINEAISAVVNDLVAKGAYPLHVCVALNNHSTAINFGVNPDEPFPADYHRRFFNQQGT